MTIEYTTLPSATASSTPVTVTVWGISQLALVKVRLDLSTVPWVVSLELSPIVTSAMGRDISTTVNVAVPPVSVVVRPLVGVTVMRENGVAGEPFGTTPVA